MDQNTFTPSMALRCQPEYYRLPALENKLMKKGRQPDLYKARRQWTAPQNLLTASSVKGYLLETNPYLYSMIFTANGGWGIYNEKTRKTEVVLSNFRHPTRWREKEVYRDCFKILQSIKDVHIEIFSLPEDREHPEHTIHFEGQGDVVSDSDYIFMGYDERSDGRTNKEAHAYIRRLLQIEKEIVPFNLVSDFYHVDTCFFNLPQREATVYYPGAFDDETNNIISSLKKKHYRVSEKLARCLVCNSVFIHDNVLLNVPFEHYSEKAFDMSAGGELLRDKNDIRYKEIIRQEEEYQGLIRFLWDIGLGVIPSYTSEYALSGAGIRCTIFFLDWR